MFREAHSLTHLILIQMKHILDHLLHLCSSLLPRRVGTSVTNIIRSLRFIASGQYDKLVLVEINLLEICRGTLVLAVLAGKLVAVAYHTVTLDGLLAQHLPLRTVYEIAFSIPDEISFSSLGFHLLVCQLQHV